MDLLSSILADKELTAYLQQMVIFKCELNHQVLSDVERYFKKTCSRGELFDNLSAEMKFQMGVNSSESNR